jgi:hypothetical protein
MRLFRLWLLALCVAACGGPPNVPPPASYSDITSLPFSQTVTQAEFNGGTYGGVANECWFRYISAADVIIGIHINSGGTYTPHIQILKSDGSTLIVQAANRTAWVLLDANTQYIRVRNNTGFGASDFDWTINVYPGTILTSVPRGSIVINDDTEIAGTDPYSGSPYPATAWSTSGTFLGFLRDVPAGEIGDALPSGISLWHARFDTAGNRLKLLDANGQLLVSTDNTVGTGVNSVLMCNDGTQFFVVKQTSGVVFNVSSAGTVSSTIATITLGASMNAFGVSRDGDILYYTETGSDIIKRWRVSTDSALSDLYTVAAASDDIGLTAVNGNPGEIIVLPDDSLVTWYVDYATTPDTYEIIHVSAAGALLHTYTLASGLLVDHIHYSAASSSAVNVWYFRSNADSTSRIGTLDITTGTLSPTFDIDNFSSGVSKVAGGSVYFGPSASCSMTTLGYGGGQIDVVKTTVPSGSTQSFSFTAGGGLTPTSFSLTDGNTQSFTGLSAGSGYSVTETVPAGWSASYVVSNGSPPNNITVVDGVTTTVTVTNTQAATPATPTSGPCCGSTGPGGAPTSTGYGGTTATPVVVPPGGAAPSYTTCNSGGGQPATAADPTDAQNLTTCKTPLVHMKWTLPDGSVRRYGKLAFTSGNGQAVSARVVKWGAVSQVLADRHGSFRANQFTVTLSDTDRAIRTILSTASTKHVDGKELEILIETAANAALSVNPLVLSRGVVTNWSFNRDMTVDLTVTDPLGYRYSSVSLDRPIPSRVCRRELFPNLPDENSGRAMPIIYGELSDDYTWSVNPSRIPVGIVPVIYVGPANTIPGVGIPGSNWHAFLIAGHAISCVASVFASNLATSPGSVRMDTSTYGTEFLVPGVNVPLYYDITGNDGVTERVSLLFASGQRADDHIAGTVPITINPWGIEDVGDGSGDTITDMALQFQHFLAYWIVQTYRTGNWGAVPTFGDGTAKVRTSSFLNCSTIHAARLGTSGHGYVGARYIGPEQKPAREWSRDFQVDSKSRLGVNHQGQLLLTTLDHTRSTSGLTTFTAQDHMVSASFEIDPQVDEVFNVYTYEYGPEPATGRVSGLAQTIRHAASITNHGEREAQALTYKGTRHKPTADDVANRSLLESFDPPTDVAFALDLRGVSLALGQLVKVTHYQGIGALGWTDRNLLITGITAYPDEDNFSTAIDLEDWHSVLALGGSVLRIGAGQIDVSTIG